MTPRTHHCHSASPSTNRDCHTESPSTKRRLSRRRTLAGVVAVASSGLGLAGCLEDEQTDAAGPAEPIDLDDGQACDVCGMVIDEHHGPAGQLFYTDGNPDEHDGPARTDSVAELVVYHQERLDRGWELREAFVTDYSSVDYDLVERDGTTYVSTHADATAFEDATELSFVTEGAIEGAMGPDHLPFSDASDAAAFADEHGGRVVDWESLVDATS